MVLDKARRQPAIYDADCLFGNVLQVGVAEERPGKSGSEARSSVVGIFGTGVGTRESLLRRKRHAARDVGIYTMQLTSI